MRNSTKTKTPICIHDPSTQASSTHQCPSRNARTRRPSTNRKRPVCGSAAYCPMYSATSVCSWLLIRTQACPVRAARYSTRVVLPAEVGPWVWLGGDRGSNQHFVCSKCPQPKRQTINHTHTFIHPPKRNKTPKRVPTCSRIGAPFPAATARESARSVACADGVGTVVRIESGGPGGLLFVYMQC